MVKIWANLCLYNKITANGLILQLSQIDDYLYIGTDVEVQKARVVALTRFECDDLGELKRYLGYKLTGTQMMQVTLN